MIALPIYHRLLNVKMAQRILVLKEGRLIEEGSHEELLDRGGEYARIFHIQAERYHEVNLAFIACLAAVQFSLIVLENIWNIKIGCPCN